VLRTSYFKSELCIVLYGTDSAAGHIDIADAPQFKGPSAPMQQLPFLGLGSGQAIIIIIIIIITEFQKPTFQSNSQGQLSTRGGEGEGSKRPL